MGPIHDDLRIEAESPSSPQRAGSAVMIRLHFHNLRASTRMLYFIVDETYRFGQSTFRFKPRTGPTEVQPMARDGYVPRHTDFHEIAPNTPLVFEQKLLLPRTTPSGKLVVEWTYQNVQDSWPSRLSDGGQPIPGIWRGKLSLQFPVQVTK